MLAILADAPLAHFRRVLEKLIDAETATTSASPPSSTAASGGSVAAPASERPGAQH